MTAVATSQPVAKIDASSMSWLERGFFALILLEIPLQIDKYFDYHADLASSGALGGWNVSVRTFALALLILGWFTARALRPRGLAVQPIDLNLPLFAYLAIVAVSTLVAESTKFALFELFLLMQAYLLYLYVAHRVKTRDDVLFVLTMLVACVALQGLIMVGLRVVGRSIDVATVFARIDHNGRVGGTIGGPNGAGNYMALMLPIMFSVLLTSAPRWLKTFAGVAFCAGVCGLLLTKSRGALDRLRVRYRAF